MSRIEGVFSALHERGKTALIPFVTAGDPNPEATVPLLHAMVDAGADLIELGIPFSDPMADGPVIQRASERALKHGVSLSDCLEMVSQFRQRDQQTPIVFMGYLNPIEVMGYAAFAARAQAAGVDGILIVDAPPEASSELLAALRAQAIDPIYLLAPTSTAERIRMICNTASGFVYYVSIKGVTGASHLDVPAVAEKLDAIRRVTNLASKMPKPPRGLPRRQMPSSLVAPLSSASNACRIDPMPSLLRLPDFSAVCVKRWIRW